MEGISLLLQTLEDEREKPAQVAAALRANSTLLRKFLCVLRSGIAIGDDARLGIENWSRPQIEAVISVSRAIIVSCVSFSADQADLVLQSIIRDSIELCICLLEKSTLESDDMSLQNTLIEVLETALIDGKSNFSEACKLPGVTIEETLPFASVDLGSLKLDCYPQYDSSDFGLGVRSQLPVGSLLMILSSDCLKDQTSPKSLTSIIHLSRQWAVTDIKCLSRLLLLIKEKFLPPRTCTQSGEDAIFYQKLSLSLKVLRFLVNLVNDLPLGFNSDLLSTVVFIADNLPKLFTLEADLSDCELSYVQNNFWGLLLNLLEEFLKFVKLVFCGYPVYHNVRVIMIASLVDALDLNTWRYDILGYSLKSPVVFFPQTVMLLLRLIGEVKNQKSQLLVPSSDESHSFSCCVDSKEVFLLRRYTTEEHMRIIFPSSRNWIDDLLHLAYFLHSEGLRCRTKNERHRLAYVKSNVSDMESIASHEEEAIFGDLFSEASKSDGNEQLPILPITPSTHHTAFTLAATELLNFLKSRIFSKDWDFEIFSEASRKFNEHHIDYLLSMLLSQGSTDERNLSPQPLSLSNELCFEILHDLIIQHVICGSLQEHLTDKILTVSNGKYLYNEHTLVLLAQSLVSSSGSNESHLARRVFKSYSNFILKRAKEIFISCPELMELSGNLPYVFHLEILMMAFHLSNEAEKTLLAKSMLDSLREISKPSDGSSQKQLSCWALLVSRLILLLRHLVFHSAACPLWLLLSFKSKLGVSSSAKPSFPHNPIKGIFHQVSAEAGNILGDIANELPALNVLLPYLIDVVVLSPADFSFRSYDESRLPGLDIKEMTTTFSSFLGFWSGRRAETVEDLLLERYLLMLCWDTCLYVGSFGCQKAESFVKFGNLVLNSCSFTSEGSNLMMEVIEVLPQLADCNAEQGWDFLRNGSCLSFVISLINAGWMHSVRYNLSGSDSWIEANAKCKFLSSAEVVVASLTESGKIEWLLSILSSCLKQQLHALQEAFLSVISDGQYHREGLSYLQLFKHVLADGHGQNDVLEKFDDSKSSHLDSLVSLLRRLSEISSMESMGILPARALNRCLLHGFPSHSSTDSGLLLSCVLSVGEIVCAIDGLLMINSASGDCPLDERLVHEMMESLTSIKWDIIFRHIHGKCDSIFSSLSPSFRNLDYVSLYEMKHLLSTLSDLHLHGAPYNAIHEALIMATLEKAEFLRRDPSRAVIFQIFLGTEQATHTQFIGHHITYQILFTAIEKCSSEVINLNVLSFLVSILNDAPHNPAFGETLRKRFLEVDLSTLSMWIERRILGIREETNGTLASKESSSALRELTMTFLSCLISQPADMETGELCDRVVEAMLLSLENAFTLYEIDTTKAFFIYLVQLLGGQSVTKRFLDIVFPLIDTLADREDLLQHLKFLFSFLRTVLGDPGFSKSTTTELSKKLSSVNAYGVDPLATRQTSRKNPETLAPSRSQETDSTNMDCGATSGEDDEEDGTSDGELASIDKEDDDDANSERSLASKLCTFTSSGNTFIEQHWYFCYTCDLTVSKGCCSVCARVCHRGHRVVYSRLSRFFCDCGAGGVRGSSCLCLKPRKFPGSSNSGARSTSGFKSLLPLSEDGDQILDSDSDLDGDAHSDTECSFKFSIPIDTLHVLKVLLGAVDTENNVLELCRKLAPVVIKEIECNISQDSKVVWGSKMSVTYNTDIFQLKKTFKSGSLDLKIKADYSNSKDLKSHLANGSLVKSLLSVSNRGRLAVGEGDKIAIFDASQLIGQSSVVPMTADKSSVKPLSRNIVRFEIVHLVFNPMVENYLAVAGYEECQILTLNSRGEITDRLPIELALHHAHVRRIDWVPGSQVHLMVVTNMFVKIYDLSQDNMVPAHYFNLKGDSIVDASLVLSSMGKLCALVLSESGSLYRLEFSIEGDAGVKSLTEVLHVEGRVSESKGRSLYFSPIQRLLFLSYQDGTTLIGRMDAGATALMEVSSVHEEKDEDGQARMADMHHWRDLLLEHGIFICFSIIKSNAALAVSFGETGLVVQNLRYMASPILPLVGVAAYKPISKEKSYCFVLQEDGSLQIYSHASVSTDMAENLNFEKAKKLGAGMLSSKGHAGMNTDFPVDFFEKTICITGDIKLSGDAIKGDSEAIKQKLQSEDGFWEFPNPLGLKITVSNLNPDLTMVGIRVQVGNSSLNHIPSEIRVFQRVIKLDEGMRLWYDIPFTTSESLISDEEFTFSIGPTYDGLSYPRIDSLEIYGQSKDDFGWKQKMEAVLNLGANHTTPSVRKNCQALQSASAQDQVFSEALNLLSQLYSSSGSLSCVEHETLSSELGNIKCKDILETVFQNDCKPSLQVAASRVLKAIFPRKESYHHVKDTMQLLGVTNSLPKLRSRIGVGGNPAGLVVKEFMARLRAVSRIALHRRSNLVSFLEIYGSEVIDGMMDVLWMILDLERPDAQTISNIVLSSVDLLYYYADCLTLHETTSSGVSVAPAVVFLKKLLLAPYETVQTASSLALSSRLLQVPFPKQMILSSTDEAAENPSSVNVPSDAGSNTNVLIEEDGNLSSVQYCCDGCSTVPILRRRWHCNVCPDFDLCETCYELMDADQLPPPHFKDHPMSAIPIEMDSVGGEGRGGLFGPDELTGMNLNNTQNSASSVLESTESGNVPPQDQRRFVSISASKKAVNSLLLRQLIVELKGWMKGTSGLRAIPLMQLFYRLFSASGGLFMDSSKPESMDLEKFVKWFVDEINLNRPFEAEGRSSFGEVSILLFMFFTLMLRNWHQPSSESSQVKPLAASGEKPQEKSSSSQVQKNTSLLYQPGDDLDKNEFVSQLASACSSLRQQSFVNYLMDILHQLVSVFKSSQETNVDNIHGSSGSSQLGCGSLLSIRKDLPAGNYLPFFSDSYLKAHKTDLFADYHRLLVENTFRLVYSLVRPEKNDKGLGKEKTPHRNSSSRELKLDGYQDVLCAYICNPDTTFVRRYARRLLLHLCGSKTQYYQVRDMWLFSNEVKKLYELGSKFNGFKKSLPYEKNVKLVKSLTALSEVAGARPRNWQKYCIKNREMLSFLMDGVFYFGEESAIQTLKLLNLAFYTGKDASSSSAAKPEVEVSSQSQQPSSVDVKKKRKGDDESNSEKSYLDMDEAISIFCIKEGAILQHFIDSFLLEWNSSSLRSEAKSVLYGAWNHSKKPFQETLLNALLDKIKILPRYGHNGKEYTELLISLLGKPHESEAIINKCLTPDVIKGIFETLHSQNELLANHPNSRIYCTLGGLVEFDGYYLESDPCISCSCPEAPYTRMKLESLKSETKFTDNRIIVKCTGSHSIQTVTMNVHDARKSRSVKVLNLYYNNTPVADLSELKNNWSMWKRAKSCHLAFNQTELKVDFPIPITACNFMIELDSFYESLQASSLETLQCPRCSRSVTDKHGICSHCHENAYQCRQCRNINYENLNSFLCNECGYSKYGRFEFNFTAKPSFLFDPIENDEEMKKVLVTIECESENAHKRYQQLLSFKKPMLKLLSSIGEHEIESSSQQQKEAVQQLVVSLPGPSCKINRKIAILGVLYGEKCKGAFDSVSKSVQMLQGLRQVLVNYLNRKGSCSQETAVTRLANNCYGCAATFAAQCMELLQVLSKKVSGRKQLVGLGILSELFENNIHQGPKSARTQARAVLCAFSEGDPDAVTELNGLIQRKVMYCLEHHRSMDISQATREELVLLSETCSLVDEFWEARLRVAFKLLFSSITFGAKHPAISEYVILPCLRIVSQACTPPKTDNNPEKKDEAGKSATKKLHSSASSSELGISLASYSEWEKGSTYIDFVRRQYRVSQVGKSSKKSRDYLALKYGLRWRRVTCRKTGKTDFSSFELGSWISVLILSACSQSIRGEVCSLFNLLCPENSFRQFQLLGLLMNLLPASLPIGESAAEYFDLFFKMIESKAARMFLTSRGCLSTLCTLITQEVNRVDSQERRLNVDISQGFVLHKLVELLSKFLEVPAIRVRFMRAELISQVLEAFLVLRGLILQKTKLISDCSRLLKELIDGLLLESTENKRLFIRACISGLQIHSKERKGRTSLFILEQLCNVICPSKAEPVYLLNLNKAHTQEEFIRGSMTKNPYSSNEIGQLMRDVKNKICNQLDLLGLLEDDYGMELLVAGSIISLDLSIAQVYEQVWKKSCAQSQNAASGSILISSSGVLVSGDSPPMTVTYRLQGLDGEATEPMIKELDEDREESQDPEVEFAIAGAVRECGGLEVILSIIQRLGEEGLKSNEEELMVALNLLTYCCKIRENRRALLRQGALSLILDTARRAFAVDSVEPAEILLLIVESLSIEANDSNLGITSSNSTFSSPTEGQEAKKIILMFLERLSHKSPRSKSHKQQRKDEMVARILPYLTYGEPAAMEALIHHFDPYLRNWVAFDLLQGKKEEDEEADQQRNAVENFVRLSESLRTSSCGERLKDMILDKGLTGASIQHLADSFPNSVMEEGLERPSVPVILSMLRGICRGHRRTQECIEAAGILPLLHALERVPGENEIGVRAENLLDTLADKDAAGDGFLGDQIIQLRHATREELRRRALLKRQQLLQGMGMKQEVGKIVMVAKPSIMEEMEVEEEEETGLACMVCREGYSLRPADALGVYSYTKRVSLGGATRGDCVYTTVSHFNVIHFQCHHEAKRADAALKNPKKEWEGAALRNNETLCNSVFPIKGPALPNAQYMRYLDQHWDNLAALGRADGSRLRLLSYDIVLMLARFATGASFSTDSRGGGKESNARFLPFMIQMAAELLEQPPSSRPSLSRSITTYLSSDPTNASPEETVQFMMVTSLLADSYQEWSLRRLSFLRRGLRHASTHHRHEGSLFSMVKPILVYVGLVEQLQRFFKARLQEDGWEAGMRERLADVKEMMGFSRVILPWLEDMTSSEDLQEALDVMGFLGDVLSAGYSSCLVFVQSTISSPLPL